MSARWRRGTAALAVLAAIVLLAYLRDPPWLLDMTHGLHPWEVGADGVRYRWAAGHSAFFVPADARAVTIPMRTSFRDPADWPIVATVMIDDRVAERLTLRDDSWREVRLTMPPPGSRRTRRIDIHLDRIRAEERGIVIGEVAVR